VTMPFVAVAVWHGLPVAAREVLLHALDDAHLRSSMQHTRQLHCQL
jgi:hypothetical protein